MFDIGSKQGANVYLVGQLHRNTDIPAGYMCLPILESLKTSHCSVPRKFCDCTATHPNHRSAQPPTMRNIRVSRTQKTGASDNSQSVENLLEPQSPHSSAAHASQVYSASSPQQSICHHQYQFAQLPEWCLNPTTDMSSSCAITRVIGPAGIPVPNSLLSQHGTLMYRVQLTPFLHSSGHSNHDLHYWTSSPRHHLLAATCLQHQTNLHFGLHQVAKVSTVCHVQGIHRFASGNDEPRLPWQQQHPKLGESLGK